MTILVLTSLLKENALGSLGKITFAMLLITNPVGTVIVQDQESEDLGLNPPPSIYQLCNPRTSLLIALRLESFLYKLGIIIPLLVSEGYADQRGMIFRNAACTSAMTMGRGLGVISQPWNMGLADFGSGRQNQG